MSYSVGTLWVIYIIVVIATFILLWCILRSTQYYYDRYGNAFFLATLFGAIAVFIGTSWLDPNLLNNSDKIWLSVLFIFAFLLPIIVIFYVVWSGEYAAIICRDKCLPDCSNNKDNCHD